MGFSLIQQQALGLDMSALCEWQQEDKTFLLHAHIAEPLALLQDEALKAGFDLRIVSAHRDFSRQLAIWNAKAGGSRLLLDAQGQPLVFESLTNEQKLFAIMRWSALPGLSRHHWGTDFDIYDANRMALEDVQLLPQEVEGDGPCAGMHRWLSERIATNSSCHFYRPYQFDNGGIAPEMWHLSYLPVAMEYARQLNSGMLLPLWEEKQLLLLNELKANLTAIWPNYVQLDTQGQPDWVLKMLSRQVFD